jgi:hypothetical protein
VTVLVHADDAVRARELIDAHKAKAAAEPDSED